MPKKHPTKRKSKRALPASRSAASGKGASRAGFFPGEPRTEWLTESDAPDRRMKVLDSFRFTDRDGTIWPAAAGTIVDGASIPRALWTLVGSPYTGDYRRASIVHDVACVKAGDDYDERVAADQMFFRACRAGGCSVFQSIILYIGVRIGAHSDWVRSWKTAQQLSFEPRLARTATEERLESDFREIVEDVIGQGETEDTDILEQRFQDSCRGVLVVQRSAVRGGIFGFRAATLPASSDQSVFPTFANLAAAYDIDGHACPDVSPSPNLCAVRVSRAMEKAGHVIDTTLYAPNNLCRHNYARGAQDLGAYLRKVLGPRTLGFSNPGKVPDELKRKRGILLFANIPDFTGQGHIDLWDGTSTRTGEYWNADPIWFWELS